MRPPENGRGPRPTNRDPHQAEDTTTRFGPDGSRTTAGVREAAATGRSIPPDWLLALRDRLLDPETPRCRHLRARPGQTAWAWPTDGRLRCFVCQVGLAAERMRRWRGGRPALDPVEAGVCHRCRRVRPGELVGPVIVRQGRLGMLLALCQSCHPLTAADLAPLDGGGR